MSVIQQHGPTVVWRRVWIFYGIALTGPVLAAVVLLAMGRTAAPGLVSVFTLASAMLFPLGAGLITERIARRRPLLSREWERARRAKFRAVGATWAWSGVAYAVIFAVTLLVAWLTAAARVPGAGTWRTQAEFDAFLAQLNPAAAGASLPIAAMVGMTLVQAFLAGITINGVFAFGEEYGWRGVLSEEVRPLGLVKANLLVGVLWGLWHAPLIALGHNYGPDWIAGIPMFVVITIPLSFILWWARERSTWVAAPAVVHGAFNGFAGIFAVLVAGAGSLIAVPVGLLGGLALALVAAILWTVPGLRPASARVPDAAPAHAAGPVTD